MKSADVLSDTIGAHREAVQGVLEGVSLNHYAVTGAKQARLLHVIYAALVLLDIAKEQAKEKDL